MDSVAVAAVVVVAVVEFASEVFVFEAVDSTAVAVVESVCSADFAAVVAAGTSEALEFGWWRPRLGSC